MAVLALEGMGLRLDDLTQSEAKVPHRMIAAVASPPEWPDLRLTSAYFSVKGGLRSKAKMLATLGGGGCGGV